MNVSRLEGNNLCKNTTVYTTEISVETRALDLFLQLRKWKGKVLKLFSQGKFSEDLGSCPQFQFRFLFSRMLVWKSQNVSAILSSRNFDFFPS